MDNFDLRAFISEGKLQKNIQESTESNISEEEVDKSKYRQRISREFGPLYKKFHKSQFMSPAFDKLTDLFHDWAKEMAGEGGTIEHMVNLLHTQAGRAIDMAVDTEIEKLNERPNQDPNPEAGVGLAQE